ncbi:hypothetical protein N9H93_02705 [Rhizobiaceae bacterium]|nr:hypothetical protein [Rhizobiaceae bacterium]
MNMRNKFGSGRPRQDDRSKDRALKEGSATSDADVTVGVLVRVSPDVRRKFKQLALDRNSTAQKLLRKALKEFLDRQEQDDRDRQNYDESDELGNS